MFSVSMETYRMLGAILRSIDSRVRKWIKRLGYIILGRGIIILGYHYGMV